MLAGWSSSIFLRRPGLQPGQGDCVNQQLVCYHWPHFMCWRGFNKLACWLSCKEQVCKNGGGTHWVPAKRTGNEGPASDSWDVSSRWQSYLGSRTLKSVLSPRHELFPHDTKAHSLSQLRSQLWVLCAPNVPRSALLLSCHLDVLIGRGHRQNQEILCGPDTTTGKIFSFSLSFFFFFFSLFLYSYGSKLTLNPSCFNYKQRYGEHIFVGVCDGQREKTNTTTVQIK